MNARTPQKQISRAYRVLLGRKPSLEELRAHVVEKDSLRAVVERLSATEEHVRNLEESAEPNRRGVLAGSARAESIAPPGTISSDENSIVGQNGFVFIYGGSNSTLMQFEGKTPLKSDLIEQWREAMDFRASGAKELSAELACLIIPDKLALLPDDLPVQLPGDAVRPIQQLQEAIPERFVYPAGALCSAAKADEVAYRTDSHLSLFGAQVVYQVVMDEFGLQPADEAAHCSYNEVVRSSALGKSFTPSFYDVQDVPRPIRGAVVESNEMEVGLHRGVVRKTINPRAEHKAKIVVVGDSYCLPWRSGQLGFLIERTFSEAHFLWSAMGWDSDYLNREQPDYVLLEMAERFAIRPPVLDVRINQVAAKANRGRRRKLRG